MELQTLANLGEFLGGVGVVVSLVYLAVQIRANTSSQRSENYGRSLERMAAMQAMFAREDELTRLFNRGLISPDDLSWNEKIRFTWVLTELFGNLEFMFFQAQQGTISPELWQRWVETLKWWLTFPGVRAWWAGKPTPFTPEFTACVERCISAGYQPAQPGAWETYMASHRA